MSSRNQYSSTLLYPVIFPTFDAKSKGAVAEWLGRGLQNLLQRFESAQHLNKKRPRDSGVLLF